MSKPPKPKPMCGYCGQRPGIERAHVFSKALFRPQTPNLLTIPSCSECNRGLAEQEDAFRDMLAVDDRNRLHPVANEKMFGPVLRATARHQSVIGSALLEKRVLVPQFTDDGIWTNNSYMIRMDSDWLRYVLCMMVRALYYYHFRHCLPANHTIDIRPSLNSLQVDVVLVMFRQSSGQWTEIRTLGDDVVNWAYCRLGGYDDAPTLWMMSFYNSFYVYASTRDETYDLIDTDAQENK